MTNTKDAVQVSLSRLADKGILIANKDNKFSFPRGIETQPNPEKKEKALSPEKIKSDRKVVVGTIDMTRNGSAYIIGTGLGEDVFVAPKNVRNALHGDRVKVQTWFPKGRNRSEGEVLEIVERAAESFIGTIRISKKYAIVIPDRLNMLVDILVDIEDIKDAKEGDKVVVRVIKWHSKAIKSPIGRVVTVLA